MRTLNILIRIDRLLLRLWRVLLYRWWLLLLLHLRRVDRIILKNFHLLLQMWLLNLQVLNYHLTTRLFGGVKIIYLYERFLLELLLQEWRILVDLVCHVWIGWSPLLDLLYETSFL